MDNGRLPWGVCRLVSNERGVCTGAEVNVTVIRVRRSGNKTVDKSISLHLDGMKDFTPGILLQDEFDTVVQG